MTTLREIAKNTAEEIVRQDMGARKRTAFIIETYNSIKETGVDLEDFMNTVTIFEYELQGETLER